MNTFANALSRPRLLLAILAVISIGVASAAQAAVINYYVNLSGPNESPVNASPGVGIATVDVDPVAHTLHIHVVFSGLVGTTTASHIHAATAVAGTGTAGVATTTPFFAGFPIGVTSGSYDNTLDMTQASSYNPSYVTAHGGTTAQAEIDLFAAIAAGKAYLNIHSTQFPGGEIRGFLSTDPSVPAETTTWGRLRNLYH
jgi:hypothetical protein